MRVIRIRQQKLAFGLGRLVSLTQGETQIRAHTQKCIDFIDPSMDVYKRTNTWLGRSIDTSLLDRSLEIITRPTKPLLLHVDRWMCQQTHHLDRSLDRSLDVSTDALVLDTSMDCVNSLDTSMDMSWIMTTAWIHRWMCHGL
eukprot:1192309-Amorphochlora_amoeboformis.AAC.1